MSRKTTITELEFKSWLSGGIAAADLTAMTVHHLVHWPDGKPIRNLHEQIERAFHECIPFGITSEAWDSARVRGLQFDAKTGLPFVVGELETDAADEWLLCARQILDEKGPDSESGPYMEDRWDWIFNNLLDEFDDAVAAWCD